MPIFTRPWHGAAPLVLLAFFWLADVALGQTALDAHVNATALPSQTPPVFDFDAPRLDSQYDSPQYNPPPYDWPPPSAPQYNTPPQGRPPYNAPPFETPDFATSAQMQTLTSRLEQTEAELRAMRANQAAQAAQLSAGGLGNILRQRWSEIRDPAITTVDQQTRQPPGEEEWFDRLSIRGYSQFRINEVVYEAPGSAPPYHPGDGSIGKDQSFFIRRARVILSGDVSDHMYVYIQPDFAAAVPGVNDNYYYTQLRDCYCDIYFDTEKIHRLRVGQSKVPYGWENLQSSSNRIPLDRADGLNTAQRNERDLGVFYYYTPDFAQDLFKYVLDNGLKGSGNYGMLGFGFYNGQGGSIREQNDNLHFVVRFTLPMQFYDCQVMEASVQAYTGRYTVLTAPINPLGVPPPVAPIVDPNGYLDERVGPTFVWYPQPFGFQTEWNWGHGPVLNAEQTEVVDGRLFGGYAMAMYRLETENLGVMFPFVRYHHYVGGYKWERNAPDSHINAWELGMEWQFNPQMELTTQFMFDNRTNGRAMPIGESYEQFVGNVLRVQFQMNY